MKSTLGVLLLAVGAMANAGAWTYRDFPNWDHIVPHDSNECNSVGTQSPIDIVAASTVDMTNDLKYAGDSIDSIDAGDNSGLLLAAGATTTWDSECGPEVEQFMNPHTWEVEFPDGVGKCKREEANDDYPHVTFKGKKYFLKQFHYHAPSEHSFDGKFTDMEAHHVHLSTDGQALVIAVNLKVGEENSFMAQFWGGFPSDVTTKAPASKIPGWTKFSPYWSFLPLRKSYYHYMGSFTTPQCTTNTIWILLKDTLTVSEAQLSQYRTAISANPADVNQLLVEQTKPPGVSDTWNVQLGVNNRPVQPVGERKIYSYDETIDLTGLTAVVSAVVAGGLVMMCAVGVAGCCGLMINLAICYGCWYCLCRGGGGSYKKSSRSNRSSSSSSSSSSSDSDSSSD